MCDCLQLTIEHNAFGEQTIVSEIGGVLNGYNWWSFLYGGETLYIFWFGGRWFCSDTLGGLTNIYVAKYGSTDVCPQGELSTYWSIVNGWTDLKTFTTLGVDCPNDTNCSNQDRTFKQYGSIKLPQAFQEQNRGLKECCCTYNVLGDPAKTNWKNDLTSAWIKLSSVSDTSNFVLKKDGVVASYTPTSVPFVNEPFSFYTTINWGDVITSDGVGCYTIEIAYSISGVSGTLTWGTYQLQPYSIQNALNTARVRAIFDGQQQVEQMNFSGSEIESTFRFFGYIGNRQPNTEVDNIIYSNREMKRVIRENLNTYEVITDPSDECITRPLLDLFFLSENQLFISDYNAHNHSYRYQDLPVIVSESPEVEYYDFSRKAKLSCKVSDKFKNKRTYY